MINLYNMDCMELLKNTPNKYYDLAIVDPPYGLGTKTTEGGCNKNSQVKFKNHNWDNSIPSKDYFNELKRVSKEQIIWGGNYMAEHIGNTKCIIIWDKMTYIPTMSQFEFAFCSMNKHPKLITINSNDLNRFHPTQKPVKLYKWLLKNYATCHSCENKGWVWLTMGKQTDCPKCKGHKPKILDTHCGSGSIMLACHDMGFDLDATELDTDYYNAALKRYTDHIKQLKLL